MSTDLLTRIGSITKTFTVTGILQLVDQKLIGLDDPISDYIDGVPFGDIITIRHLAQMQHGLADYSRTEAGINALMNDPLRNYAPEELLKWAFAESTPLKFTPGQGYEYSNTNAILLGRVIEKVARVSVAEYIHDNILEPLGLKNTYFPSNGDMPGPHITGHTLSDDGTVSAAGAWNAASLAWASGAMISNMEDLRRWAEVLATGSLLSPETQAERLRMAQPDGLPGVNGYGLGVFNVKGWIGHHGEVPGYSSLILHQPSTGTTAVILTNALKTKDGASPTQTIFNAIASAMAPA